MEIEERIDEFICRRKALKCSLILSNIFLIITSGSAIAYLVQTATVSHVPWTVSYMVLVAVFKNVTSKTPVETIDQTPEQIHNNSDTIYYVLLILLCVFSIGSLAGMSAAWSHRSDQLKTYCRALILLLVVVVGVICSTIYFQDQGVETIRRLAKWSLRNGFDEASTGKEETHFRAFHTYLWQWIQVKLHCCGLDDGADFELTKYWEKRVINISTLEMDPNLTAELLELPNKIITGSGMNSDEWDHSAIVLQQVIPSSCCQIEENQSSASLTEQDLKALVLVNPTCPFTRIKSYFHQGCFDGVKAMATRHMYFVLGAGGWVITLLLFAMAVSHKLAGIPTEQSIQEENEDRTRKREKLKNFLNGMLQETRSKSKTKSLDGFNTRSNGSHASYDAPIRKTRSVGRTRSKRRSQR